MTSPEPFTRLPLLEQEQMVVRDRITNEAKSWEVILVQGVAGSGKTTVALQALTSFVEGNLMHLREGMTVLYVTQNPKLIDRCRQVAEFENHQVRQYLAPAGELKRGHLNIMTTSELFSFLAGEQTIKQVMSDKECLEVVTELVARRGTGRTSLLPSQVFAIITAFLKGRADLRHKSLEDIRRLTPKLLEANAYAASISEVREFYQGPYRDELDSRCCKDRIDLVWEIHDALLQANDRFDYLKTLTRAEVRRNTRRTLGDQLPQLSEWLNRFLYTLAHSNDTEAEHREQALSLYRYVQNRGSGSDWTWDTLKEKVINWVDKYGMAGTPVIERVASLLHAPVIMIDEIQDLAEVEWRTLARLFFHLQRWPRKSRLVFLGDQNQQVMPSGFRWEDLFQFTRIEAERFGYNEERFYPLPQLRDAEEGNRDLLGPYLMLRNNYRTSEEIARFAKDLGQAMADRIFSSDQPDQKRRYIDRLIDPLRTVNYSEEVARDYESLPDEYRKPQVVIASRGVIIAAIREYVNDAGAQNRDGGLVFLTRDTIRLEDDIGSQGVGVACYTPLTCKGLEFRGVSIVDLPRKDDTEKQIDMDVVAQWYCAVTRPRVLLALFLTPEEMDYLDRMGWSLDKISACARIIGSPEGVGATVEECVAVLKQTRTQQIASPELAENYLLAFREYPKVQWRLDQAIKIFSDLGDTQGVRTAQRAGARIYEDQQIYALARQYYEQIGDPVASARCFRLEIQQLRTAGRAADADQLALDARDYATGKESQVPNPHEIWEQLGDFVRAVQLCLRQRNLPTAEQIARKITDLSGRTNALIEIAEAYWQSSQYGSLSRAYEIYWDIGLRPKCQSIEQKMRGDRRYSELRKTLIATNQMDTLAALANTISNERQHEQAAACYEAVGDLENALSRWDNATSRFDARIHELFGPDVTMTATNWYRRGLGPWVRAVLQRDDLDLADEVVARLQRLNAYLQPRATFSVPAGEESQWRDMIEMVSKKQATLPTWLDEAREELDEIERRVLDDSEESTEFSERLEQARVHLSQATLPAQLDELRREWFDLLTWYERQTLQRIEKTWAKASESKDTKNMRLAFEREFYVIRNARARTQEETETEITPLQQEVLRMWSVGDADDMAQAAWCWGRIDGMRRWQLEARIDTNRPGIVRTYQRGAGRYDERNIGMRPWVELMIRLNNTIENLPSREMARQALVNLIDSGSTPSEERQEAQQLMVEHYASDRTAANPRPDRPMTVDMLIQTLLAAIDAEAAPRVEINQVRPLLQSLAVFHQAGQLNNGNPMWDMLAVMLRPASPEVQQLFQQLRRQVGAPRRT